MPDEVRLRAIDGRRSTQATGAAVVAAAAEATGDAGLAAAIARERDWRKRYLGHVRGLIEAGVRGAAVAGARAGLATLADRLEVGDDGVPIRAAVTRGEAFPTATIRGRGGGRPELAIPYRGGALRGDAIRERLDAWVGGGIIEPSAAEAVEKVLANPDWLDLSDRRFLLLGAASEMGPLEPVCAWGATIAAVDLPRPDLWRRILDVAQAGRGRVDIPLRHPVSDDGDIPDAAGADLLSETARIGAWARALDGPLTVEDSTYADGSTFLLVAGTTDALIADLLDRRDDLSLAYLATPTDVFAVPEEVVRGARTRRPSPWTAPGRATARGLSIGRLYRRNYTEMIEGADGRSWGISDCLVAQQGPNYALAKNAQRWRAMAARADGAVVSSNVAPPTRTRSVVKNRILGAAYGGAGAFGVEVFEPATSRWLMAALLVHDIRNPGAPHGHPYDLFAESAAHGGIWRLGFEPRSVLPLAVVRGLGRRGRQAGM